MQACRVPSMRREVQVREPGRTTGRRARQPPMSGQSATAQAPRDILAVFPMASQFGPAVGYHRPVRGRLIGWENPDEEDHKSDNDQRARDQRCTRSDPVPPMLRKKKCPISQYGGADRHCEPSPSSIDLLDSEISFPAQVDLTWQLEEMSAAWNRIRGSQAKSDKLQEHLRVLVRAFVTGSDSSRRDPRRSGRSHRGLEQTDPVSLRIEEGDVFPDTWDLHWLSKNLPSRFTDLPH